VWKQGVPVGDTTNRTAPADDPQPPVPPASVKRPERPGGRRRSPRGGGRGEERRRDRRRSGREPLRRGQGDDTTPELAPSQAKLIDALKATGKPVIVVVIAGRPLVMNQQLDESDAALMAFLPGSEGGPAIANALFGSYNPGGRLSVSWPKASSQEPLAYNDGGSYDPRYPFGYGLSYTRFNVDHLQAPSSVNEHGRVDFSLDLRNTGGRAGDDVVLAFVKRLGAAGAAGGPRLVPTSAGT